MKTIRVLQLGADDYSKRIRLPDCAEWHYEPDVSQPPERDYDVAVLDREITEDEFEYLIRWLRAYTLFITETAPLKENGAGERLLARKKGRRISEADLRTLLEEDLPDYFSGSYGEKFEPFNVSVAQGFRGSVSWTGSESVNLAGDFGEELTQAVFWRNNIPVEAGQALEFWLEYAKDPGVEISLEITMFQFLYGTDPESKRTWTFTEKDLEDIVYLRNETSRSGHLFMSLKAKGTGRLAVTALHDRYSRRGKGLFLPGGKRRVTPDREEVFYYFDPGNLKPPLNVYFSGYKTREGFEGYNMMRRLGHPFLLIAEARLEGGASYMGPEAYEDMIEGIIRDHMEELGFGNSEVILSGLSMGSFGALYYGCKIRPHSVLVGKPLASFGDIAENERINRPGGFPTSLDVLHKFCGSLDREAAGRLNGKFWNAFDQTDWSGTQFAVAYMIEDDYDRTSYEKLQSHLKGSGVRIYGKGLHGRHNDNTPGIVNWFVKQYDRIIEDYFDNTRSGIGGREQ